MIFVIQFFIYFIFYFALMSPTITGGPSSVLTAIVSSGGVPNPTGYPLYLLLSKMWLSLNLFSLEPAFLLNLFSVICTSLSLSITSYSIYLLVRSPANELVVKAFCVLSLVPFSMSPALLNITTVAERYSLNLLVLALLLFFSVKIWKGEKPYIKWLLLFLGLSPHSHYMTAPIGLIFFSFLVLYKKIRLKDLKWSFMIFIGLSVIFILPLVSLSDPLLDWSNTKTWNGLWRTITRAQMGPIQVVRPLDVLYLQWLRQLKILFTHLGPLVFLLPLGIFIGNSWKVKLMACALLLSSGELVTIFKSIGPFAFSKPLQSLLTSHMATYYLPYMWVVSILLTFILIWVLSRIHRKSLIYIYFFVVFGMSLPWKHFGEVWSRPELGMSSIYKEFLTNIPKGSVVFTDIDSVYMNVFYQQKVLGVEDGSLWIHTNLLRGEWYKGTLEKIMPQVMRYPEVKDHFEKYFLLVRKFEHNEEVDFIEIEQSYQEMIQWFMRKAVGRVYFIFDSQTSGGANGKIDLRGKDLEVGILGKKWLKFSEPILTNASMIERVRQVDQNLPFYDFWSRSLIWMIAENLKARATWLSPIDRVEAEKMLKLGKQLSFEEN